MPDYKAIENHCSRQSELLKSFLDDFLLDYCAEREGLARPFAKKLFEYRSIIKVMPENWPEFLASQYIAFKLFRKNGFAGRYLNHPEIRSRNEEEFKYLVFQIEHPWRFSFCSVENNPAEHFYEMTDVLTNESFLLYSPGVSQIITTHGHIPMFFFLLGFNGQRWQTYGPNAYHKGLIPTDLLFFAKQLSSNVHQMNQIPDLIEINPLPFMMLWKSGDFPLTYHHSDMIVINSSEYTEENFDPLQYTDDFKILQKYPLYKLSLKRWDQFPHFASCYYHSKKKRLILYAMTDRGYAKLHKTLKEIGYNLPSIPENRITINMLGLVKEILRKDVQLNSYEKVFSEPVSPEDSKQIEKINVFTDQLMDALNKKEEVDIERYASVAGIDMETAHSITIHILEMVARNPKKSGKR